MKQMSDVETTTSSRPPLTSLLMAPLAAVWSERFASIIRRQALQATRMRVDDFYDRHPISEQEVLAAVARRRGGDLSQLSPDDLFEFDQDHYGGLQAVDELASRAGIATASHVLDVCAGLGGPARFLASRRRAAQPLGRARRPGPHRQGRRDRASVPRRKLQRLREPGGVPARRRQARGSGGLPSRPRPRRPARAASLSATCRNASWL